MDVDRRQQLQAEHQNFRVVFYCCFVCRSSAVVCLRLLLLFVFVQTQEREIMNGYYDNIGASVVAGAARDVCEGTAKLNTAGLEEGSGDNPFASSDEMEDDETLIDDE